MVKEDQRRREDKETSKVGSKMKEIGGKAHKVKVKMKEKMSDKGRVTQKGRSEGGWILGKNGFYTADPKWTGGE